MILKRIRNLWAWSEKHPLRDQPMDRSHFHGVIGDEQAQFIGSSFRERFDRAEKVDDLVI